MEDISIKLSVSGTTRFFLEQNLQHRLDLNNLELTIAVTLWDEGIEINPNPEGLGKVLNSSTLRHLFTVTTPPCKGKIRQVFVWFLAQFAQYSLGFLIFNSFQKSHPPRPRRFISRLSQDVVHFPPSKVEIFRHRRNLVKAAHGWPPSPWGGCICSF